MALDEATEKRLKEMEEKIANYEAKESKEARAKEVVKAMEKHKIPAYLRDRLAKSISDDEDIEDAVSAIRFAVLSIASSSVESSSMLPPIFSVSL